MLTPNEFEIRLAAALDDPEVLAMYQSGEPLVYQHIRAHAAFLALLSQDIDRATTEPFIKSTDRSILADATNKGILPVGTPARHLLTVKNSSNSPITLAQGRVVLDGQGRPWRLLQSLSLVAHGQADVLIEQSTVVTVTVTPAESLPFWRVTVPLQDGMALVGLTVRNESGDTYRIAPRWMNVAPAEKAVQVVTDSLMRVFIEFGDTDRAGETVMAGSAYTIQITQTYGALDASRLKDAALSELINVGDEQLSFLFKAGGLQQVGTNPLSIDQLRQLASYPALYDENAVYLGNFEYLARQKFSARVDYLAVWNETVQDRLYGAALADINHLHLAVKAKNPVEQAAIEADISALLGRADSLFDGRVIVHAIAERPFSLVVTGRIAAVHDLDAVGNAIKGLLVERFGKGSLSASRWLPNGINLQEASVLLRAKIPAFQDRISDFSIQLTGDLSAIKPHQWVFVSNASITLNLTRTADVEGTLWTV